MSYPRISVVTPSYNQGIYLEETIRSVLDQNYPNLEYIVIDGGSTDTSTQIIRKYSDRLAYAISEPDQGQADALNKGFKQATGEIICWLNSDDFFEPNTLWTVAKYFNEHQKTFFIYGDGWIFRQSRPWARKYHRPGIQGAKQLNFSDQILQPSSFWTRHIFEEVGYLDMNLRYVLDWEYFLRISSKFEMAYLPVAFSNYRLHEAHKSSSGGTARAREVMYLIEQYAPQEWVEVYRELVPHCEDIWELRKWWGGRLYVIPMCIQQNKILWKYGLDKLLTTATML